MAARATPRVGSWRATVTGSTHRLPAASRTRKTVTSSAPVGLGAAVGEALGDGEGEAGAVGEGSAVVGATVGEGAVVGATVGEEAVGVATGWVAAPLHPPARATRATRATSLAAVRMGPSRVVGSPALTLAP